MITHILLVFIMLILIRHLAIKETFEENKIIEVIVTQKKDLDDAKKKQDELNEKKKKPLQDKKKRQ